MIKTPSQILEEQGWLTLNQFVQYLKDEHSIKSLSYPAILRYVEKGILEATKVGGQRRITKECIDHYLKYGVEVPYVPPADPSPFSDGEETQMSPSIPPRNTIIEPENQNPTTIVGPGLVIPEIPTSRVKRPNIPPPPDED